MSNNKKWKVLVYHPALLDVYMELLQKDCPDLIYFPCQTREEAKRYIGEADILFGSTSFPGDVLKKGSNLQWIQVMGAGVEQFALSRVRSPGVVLTRVKGTFGSRMAEYILGQMLFNTQKMAQGLEQQQRRHWELYSPEVLYEKTLGVAGLGSVGREVACKAAALDMTVYGMDLEVRPYPFLKESFGLQDIKEFVKRLDFLAICLPLTSSTQGLFNKEIFSNMKSTASIINISRGPLIVENDLIECIKAGELGGAILDVTEKEPLPPESELWNLPGVRITPHMSGPSLPSEVLAVFCENLKRMEHGGPLINVVDLEQEF